MPVLLSNMKLIAFHITLKHYLENQQQQKHMDAK